jgi:hypothetical protein
MTTNELIEDQIQKLNAYLWCEYLSKNPIHLSDFTPGQLNRLLSASQKWKQYEERFCASCVPPLNPKLNSRTWQDADFIEKSILAEFQRREPPKNKADKEKAAPAPKEAPKYELEALFIEGEKDYFLRVAIKAGIIDSAGKWILGDRKKWLIPATWYLAINRNMTAPGLDNFKACNAIAEHWGISISQTTFDDFWSARREDHSSKRGFDVYLLFLQEFTRG